MTVKQPSNKSKWTAAGASAKTADPDKSAPEAQASAAPAPAAAKSAPVAPSVKSEPIAPAPAENVPLESPAVDEAVIAAALAPERAGGVRPRGGRRVGSSSGPRGARERGGICDLGFDAKRDARRPPPGLSRAWSCGARTLRR